MASNVSAIAVEDATCQVTDQAVPAQLGSHPVDPVVRIQEIPRPPVSDNTVQNGVYTPDLSKADDVPLSHHSTKETVSRPTEDTKPSEDPSTLDPPKRILYRVEYQDYHGHTVESKITPHPFTPKSEPAGDGFVLEFTTTLKSTTSSESATEKDLRERIKDSENGEPKERPSMPGDTRIAGYSLKIHSPYIMNALRATIKYYPGNSLMGEILTLEDPFPMLVHNIGKLRAYRFENQDYHSEEYRTRSNDDLDVLIRFFDENPFLQRTRQELAHHDRAQPTCTFDHIWTLFCPGDLCYWRENGRLSGPFVISAYNLDWDGELPDPNITSFRLDVWNVCFDGTVVGRATRVPAIEKFEGERLISALNVIPAKYCKEVCEPGSRFSKERLITRGKRYWSLAKEPAYREYYGKTLQKPYKEIRGRVMIDPKVFYNTAIVEKYVLPEEDDFPSFDPGLRKDETGLIGCQCDTCTSQPAPKPRFEGYDNLDPKESSPPDEELFYMLCDERAYGYLLKDKSCEVLNVEDLEDVKLANSFENLVLPQDLKPTIKALTASYAKTPKKTSTYSPDFIKGKGEGKIILLHGPPGVGKTATAEAISDLTKRPLLSLTCGDLGVTALEVEKKLHKFLRLGEGWDAVVLLDEADIYLEARDLKDIKRNSLVSVFLRELEYYRGLLFLTTNRIKTFDEAFRSRIHVSLHYPQLKDSERKGIWKNHFRGLEANDIRIEDEAKEYILRDQGVKNLKWNGREIRNGAFSTAVSLAEYDAHTREQKVVILTLEHMKRVVQLSKQFKDYVKTLHDGRDDDYMAKARGLRNDSYNDQANFRTPKRQEGGLKGLTPKGEGSGDRRKGARRDGHEEERRSKGRRNANENDRRKQEEEDNSDEDEGRKGGKGKWNARAGSGDENTDDDDDDDDD